MFYALDWRKNCEIHPMFAIIKFLFMIFQQPKNSFSELKWISNFFFRAAFLVVLFVIVLCGPSPRSLSLPGYTGAFRPRNHFADNPYPSWISMHTRANSQQQVFYWFSLNFLLSQFASATDCSLPPHTTAFANVQRRRRPSRSRPHQAAEQKLWGKTQPENKHNKASKVQLSYFFIKNGFLCDFFSLSLSPCLFH